MKVIKRDGSKVEFDILKIANAIKKAFVSCGYLNTEYLDKLALSIANTVTLNPMFKSCKEINVECIQDIVENILMSSAYGDVAKEYIRYRDRQSVKRNLKMINQIKGLFNQTDSYLMKENANKKAELNNVQFSYLGSILSTHYCRTQIFPKEILKEHDKGVIHIHDMDMSAIEGITNCSLLNLEDCLCNGTVLNDVKIDPQTKFITACTVATQIIQGVAGLQYGGITITLSHLVNVLKTNYNQLKCNKHFLDKEDLKTEYKRIIKDGVQTFMYQVNSMFTTQG